MSNVLKLIDQFFDLATTTLMDEGKRFVQAKAVAAWIKTLKGLRKIVLGYFVSLIAVIVLTAVTMVLALHSLYQMQTYGTLSFDIPILTCIGLLTFTIAIVFILLRESSWLKAFGVNEQMREMAMKSEMGKSVISNTTNEEIQQQKLRKMLEEILDERLGQHVGVQSPSSQDKDRPETPN
ncbi:MAG: hypothetical protein IPK68_00955 [Bdellovibrionales bacterium]|nr:hypothetical protein [Bdellovibrionales bacterium]